MNIIYKYLKFNFSTVIKIIEKYLKSTILVDLFEEEILVRTDTKSFATFRFILEGYNTDYQLICELTIRSTDGVTIDLDYLLTAGNYPRFNTLGFKGIPVSQLKSFLPISFKLMSNYIDMYEYMIE